MQSMLLKFLAVAVILGAGCATALADIETDLGLAIETIGDPVPVGSFTQTIHISTSQAFNLIAVQPVNGSLTLESPYLAVTNPADGWSVLSSSTSTLAAAGTSSTTQKNEYVTISFADNHPDEGDAFLVAVWRPGHNEVYNDWEYEFREVSYSNGTWYWDDAHRRNTTWNTSRDQITAVPAPAAVVLGMLGLGLVGWLKRRVA